MMLSNASSRSRYSVAFCPSGGFHAAQLLTHRPLVGLGLSHPDLFESAQRLAHGHHGGAQLFGQRADAQPVAFGQLAGDDRLQQGVKHLVTHPAPGSIFVSTMDVS